MVAMLDRAGIALSIIMGISLLIVGGLNYLGSMLTFLAVAVAVTKYGYYEKKEIGIYEYERSWENVLSNGLIPTIAALFSSTTGPFPFICSLAAVNADKFASELGVFSKEKPIDLLTFKQTKPGKSGAVSLLGLVMSLAGALIIGVFSIFFFSITPTQALIVGGIGLLGSVADSLAGILEERGIGNKSTSNLICSLVGALLGWWVF